MDNESRPQSTSTTESLKQNSQPTSEPSKSHQETQKFAHTFLSQTTRVKGPQSGLVSWPNITPSPTQMKGTFHYIAEETASLIPLDPLTRKAIQDLINNYNKSDFEDHVPRTITAFVENLVLEANGLLDVALKKDSLERKHLGFWGKMKHYSKVEKEEMKALLVFKTKRVSVLEMLGMIWEFRAPIWDTPKLDDQGNNYWASNVEAVKSSKAFAILIKELRGLRREVLDVEDVRVENLDVAGPAEGPFPLDSYWRNMLSPIER